MTTTAMSVENQNGFIHPNTTTKDSVDLSAMFNAYEMSPNRPPLPLVGHPRVSKTPSRRRRKHKKAQQLKRMRGNSMWLDNIRDPGQEFVDLSAAFDVPKVQPSAPTSQQPHDILDILCSYSRKGPSKYSKEGVRRICRIKEPQTSQEAGETPSPIDFQFVDQSDLVNIDVDEPIDVDGPIHDQGNEGRKHTTPVSDRFKKDMEEQLKRTRNAGYAVTVTDPEVYAGDVRNAKQMFDISLLRRGLETVPAITTDQVNRMGNQSILITEECSHVGNVIYENDYQISTESKLGLLANTHKGSKDDDDVAHITDDDDDGGDSKLLEDLKLVAWEKNIMDAFNNANNDVFYSKETQIQNILQNKKNNKTSTSQRHGGVKDGLLDEIRNDLLSPLDGEDKYLISIPTIKRTYNQNFYRPAIPQTGERSCRNGTNCKVFQIHAQLIMSKRRHLVTNRWTLDASTDEAQPSSPSYRHHKSTGSHTSTTTATRGSDLCQDYHLYASKYSQEKDNLSSDLQIPKPKPLREFLTPEETKYREGALISRLALFQNEVNANYRECEQRCNNRQELIDLRNKTQSKVKTYLASIADRIAEAPPNPCILCELAECSRLARNCSNNSPLHNPELNVVTQKFSHMFDCLGEYDAKYRFTCGANYHGITKPILDFNVDNYLPDRASVVYTSIETNFMGGGGGGGGGSDVNKGSNTSGNFLNIQTLVNTKSMNVWSETEDMMFKKADSVMKETNRM